MPNFVSVVRPNAELDYTGQYNLPVEKIEYSITHTAYLICQELKLSLRKNNNTKVICFLIKTTTITSSSAMADRPCDCLRPKSPLCSCQNCQWFCAGRDAIAIRWARIMQPKRHLPNAYEILVTRYDRFRMGLGHFRWIFDIEGGIGHRPVLGSEN